MIRWSKNIEKKFKRIYPHNTDEEVAKIMRLPFGFVVRKAYELGLEKAEPAKREWSEQELKFVQKMYPNFTNQFIAENLNVSKMQVGHIAYRLGLRKSKEYMTRYVVHDTNNLVSEWSNEWNNTMMVSKGHYVTYKILQHLYPYYRIAQEEPIGNLRIDLYIPDMGLAIEYHGIQHSKFNAFFHETKMDFAKGQDNDIAKSEMLESQEIALIPIYHDEELSIGLIRQKINEVL